MLKRSSVFASWQDAVDALLPPPRWPVHRRGGVKTPEQVALYGGTAGLAYSPCYHQACDTLDEVNLEVFDQMIDAVGNSTLIYAFSTATVHAEG